MLLSNLSKRAFVVNERCLLQNIKCISKRHHQKAAMIILRSYHAKSASTISCQNRSDSRFNGIIGMNNVSKIQSSLPISYIQVRFYTLPPFNKIVLPALSPTMEMGTIVQWQVKEGDHFEPGDLLADIETDKATMGFEAVEEGYVAKILLQDGSKDVPLGTLVAVFVENKEDLDAFKDVTADQLSSEPNQATANSPKEPIPASHSNKTSSVSNQDFPSHDCILLPALSPTMTTGTIVVWEKQIGDKIEEGDSIATIETDKASMALEHQEEGYLAKILQPEGAKDLPLGTPLCIVVPNQDDIPAFANYVDSGSASPASPAPKQELPSKYQQQPISSPSPQASVSKPTGDRIFVSPLAKRLALEKGIDLTLLAGQGSGPGGRIRAQDLTKTPLTIPKPTTEVPTSPLTLDEDFLDIPLSNVRKVIAKRLLESKQTVPHYYLTSDIEMDKIMEIRKTFNKDLESEGVKLSVNDFIVKAAALACLKVPQANSSWQDSFIRQFNTVDMSIAVSTDNGLITPIVFDAHSKGLAAISKDVVALAAKAREGKLQPQEFQGGTFTISNLGMFGVKHFSAIINPPQSCILAVGSARREFVPDASSDDGTKIATVMSVTLSCDHRVVDGAVGAQWLQQFKKYLEDPVKMLL